MENKLKKNIFQIAIPIFVELLFFTLLGTVDTIMLTMYSKDAVGAVVNANSIINLFTVLLTVVATGIVVVLTKTLGAKKKEDESKVVGTGLIFNIVLGFTIAFILFLVGPILLVVIKTDGDVIESAQTYLRIISIGFIGLGVSQACGAIFRSYGRPMVIMIVAIISNILNIILNAIFINGLFGAPELGSTGAAIGTLTSNLVAGGMAILCLMFILKYSPRKLLFSKEQLKNIFKIGIPSAFEYFLYNMSQFLIMISVNSIIINGDASLSAITRSYVLIILNYVMLFSLSIANSNQIITGYYIGEKEFIKGKEFTLKNFKLALSIIIPVVLLLNVFWEPLMGLFLDDEHAIDALRGVFIVVVFLEIGRTSNIMFISALRTVNDIVFPVVMGVISMYGLAVLFSYLLGVHFGLGLLGIFIAQAMDECFRGTFMYFRWKTKDFDIMALNAKKYLE
ncbi:MAG: MATE family efflux transporter [bacterium]